MLVFDGRCGAAADRRPFSLLSAVTLSAAAAILTRGRALCCEKLMLRQQGHGVFEASINRARTAGSEGFFNISSSKQQQRLLSGNANYTPEPWLVKLL